MLLNLQENFWLKQRRVSMTLKIPIVLRIHSLVCLRIKITLERHLLSVGSFSQEQACMSLEEIHMPINDINTKGEDLSVSGREHKVNIVTVSVTQEPPANQNIDGSH